MTSMCIVVKPIKATNERNEIEMDKRKDKTTLERVISCISNVATSIAEGKITEDMTVRGDVLEESDYLDFVELLMEIEEEFDVEITEADAESITTVGSVVKIVDRKTNG